MRSVEEQAEELRPVQRRAILQLDGDSWTNRDDIFKHVRGQTLEDLEDDWLVERKLRDWRLTPRGKRIKAYLERPPHRHKIATVANVSWLAVWRAYNKRYVDMETMSKIRRVAFDLGLPEPPS